VDAFFEAAKQVIVIDHLTHATSARADVVLPAATFAESSGTLVNNEGRAQRFYQVYVPAAEIRPSWRWLQEITRIAGHRQAQRWENLDQIVAALTETLPVFKPIGQIAPGADFRERGAKIPRQAHRYSGRTAMLADLSVHEPKPPEDPDSPLAFSMEGYEGQPPAALIPRFWAPGWNSVQALNKFQSEIGGSLRGGDPGRRLIEPEGKTLTAYFDNIPPPAKLGADEWVLTAVHHIFGSEELSQYAPAVAGQAPPPYLAMHPQDAAELAAAAGETVTIILGDGPQRLLDMAIAAAGETKVTIPLADVLQRLPVKLNPSLPRKVVAAPVGLLEWPFANLPAIIQIVRRQNHD
jgi:NADH-quinone oxidoreductase subunit G